ncbi:MAG: transglutaminase-like domain-containing protein [Deltaproteobacteria bacterium]
MENFLGPTPYIDCDAQPVKEKAQKIVQGINEPLKQAVALFYAVRDGIKYSIYGKRSLPEHFRASFILAAGEGYCVQKAILLVALSRAASIPARLRLASIRSHLVSKEMLEKRGSNLFPYHGYTDLYIEGTWVKAAPTFDIVSCANAGLRPVDFDGRNDALLPSTTLDDRLHIDYLEDRGFFEDVPYDAIMSASLMHKYLKRGDDL